MKNILLLIALIPFTILSQTQIGVDIDGEARGDESGDSVSLSADGKVVAIGARLNDGNGVSSGHVRVYRNMGSTMGWVQVGSDIDGEAEGDESGGSVSLSADGKVVAIGARFNNGNGTFLGHVRVYKDMGTPLGWIQVGDDIDGESALDFSGDSVSLSADGAVVAIAARYNDGNGLTSGHVRVYKDMGTSLGWIQIGSDIDGETEGDGSGDSVSISADGKVVAIGTRGSDDNGISSGHVRVYKDMGTPLGWVQVGNDIDGESAVNESGGSVSLSADGKVVAIGARYYNIDGHPKRSGHVRIYRDMGSSLGWVQVGSDIVGESIYEELGTSVSLSADGTVVAIGAPGSRDYSASRSGYVQVYKYRDIPTGWVKMGNSIVEEASGDASDDDNSEGSVSISADGSVVAIGARLNDGNGVSSGHVRVFDLNNVLSSDNFMKEEQVGFYTNPVSNTLQITFKENLRLKQAAIYTVLGTLVKVSTTDLIDVSTLAKGTYFVEIITNKGKTTKKVIVK
ncbi:T9SS type A sorting domain-containing protein [Flavivirga eckloniae]|uniref:Secretion system C-terminal sorting domain-containing protein n=1 Tax=Flavivirga eckloniae TaxID=1803846 RepID=A0A2K9PKN5_9FLAO|nr:T9SS type A sorting domain-containing protein [Flavivirga eckloniae]AUP77595.1 hypothetical protein C1H87_02225 [Flavivirga eckloniae]